MNSLPVNEALERALLIGILQDPALLGQVNDVLDADDFYKFDHKEIYQALNSIPIEQIDSLVIEDKLSEEAKESFRRLVKDGDSILPSLSNILVYAEEIKSKSVLRECIRMASQIADVGYTPNISADDALAEVERKFANFIQSRVKDGKISSTKEDFEKFVATLGQKINQDGTKSGFFAIDMMLHRLEGLIILAARPGMGKTALAINIARNVAREKPVLFFSLEQSQDQIFERIISAEAEVDHELIRSGAYIADDHAVDKIKEVTPILSEMFNRMEVDERASLNAAQIASKTRQKRAEWGALGLIVVDYLHIMDIPDGSRTDALGDSVKQLRALGKEMNCPVILLSQLNRQPENTKDDDNRTVLRRPQLTDLRSSGDIEQSADVVVFLFRESYYKGIDKQQDSIEFIVSKNRNGRLGTTNLDWYGRYVKFTDQR